jgi:hypothetical protein
VPGSNTNDGTYGPIYHCVNPSNLNNIITTGDYHPDNSKVTFNGGASWSTITVTPRNWAEFAGQSWHTSLANETTCLVWGHNGKVLAHSCAKIHQSDDGGLTFFPGGDGFDGYAWCWSNYAVSWAANDPSKVSLYCFDNGELSSSDGGKGFIIKRMPELSGVNRVNSLKSGAISSDGNIHVTAGSEDFWACRVGQRVGSGDFVSVGVNAGFAHAAAFQTGTANVFCGEAWSNNNGATGSWGGLGYIFVGLGPGGTIFSASDSSYTNIRRNGVAATGRAVKFTGGFGPWAFRPHPTNSQRGLMMDYTGDLAEYDWSTQQWRVFGLLALTESIPGSTNNIVACDYDPSNPARIAASFVADGRKGMIFLTENGNDASPTWKDISGRICRIGGLVSLRFSPSGELWWCGGGPGRRVYDPTAV